jgi:hypothetical protein
MFVLSSSINNRALEAIAKSLSSLAPVDRLGLLGDVCAMSKSGRSSIGDLMDFAGLYQHETTFYVIEVLSAELKALASVHDGQPYYKAIQKYVHRLYEPLYNKLGWSAAAGEDQITSLFRANVLSMMGTTPHFPSFLSSAICLLFSFLHTLMIAMANSIG